MKSFRYGRDPLCVGACLLYGLNRFWWRQAMGGPFLSGQFDDLLLIPCALPVVLWLQRKLGLREHDRFPQVSEVILHLAVWSVIAEVIGPRMMSWATGDWKDVVAYSAGSVVSLLWWWHAS
ncbi:MAG TPA: hypothetical protein VMF06_07455 [Candidatus Limnocylindria bacterium]|nr:hypothetical protein [Candidatus Limnocylindria bacterium]